MQPRIEHFIDETVLAQMDEDINAMLEVEFHIKPARGRPQAKRPVKVRK